LASVQYVVHEQGGSPIVHPSSAQPFASSSNPLPQSSIEPIRGSLQDVVSLQPWHHG
jgi:hypothetical protein